MHGDEPAVRGHYGTKPRRQQRGSSPEWWGHGDEGGDCLARSRSEAHGAGSEPSTRPDGGIHEAREPRRAPGPSFRRKAAVCRPPRRTTREEIAGRHPGSLVPSPRFPPRPRSWSQRSRRWLSRANAAVTGSAQGRWESRWCWRSPFFGAPGCPLLSRQVTALPSGIAPRP